MAVVRVIIIGGLIYLLSRVVKKVLMLAASGLSGEIAQKKGDQDVIEICPDCGEVRNSRHKCRKS